MSSPAGMVARQRSRISGDGRLPAIVSNVPVRAGETQPRGSGFGAYLSTPPKGTEIARVDVVIRLKRG